LPSFECFEPNIKFLSKSTLDKLKDLKKKKERKKTKKKTKKNPASENELGLLILKICFIMVPLNFIIHYNMKCS